MDIPVKFTGTAPGLVQGGKLIVKLRNVRIKALPGNMPDSVTLDISGLTLGKSVKVNEIDTKEFEVLNNGRITIATVDIPRALKSGEFDEEESEEEEGAEAAEGATEETASE